jgi:hypothetical protein
MAREDSVFSISKRVDLAKLDKEISQKMGWERHKNKNDKNCFSGLNAEEIDNNGQIETRISIVWTDDGVNGYEKEFPINTDKLKIMEALNSHGNQ